MNVLRYAAFAHEGAGGNPAGVMIVDTLPSPEGMQRIAFEVGYSETVFAQPDDTGGYRVRYFSPESEVPFCGHATIALGAALAELHGPGVFRLSLNDAAITVEGMLDGGSARAALQSPPTKSRPAEADLVAAALALFSFTPADLDERIPPVVAEAGATHLILALTSRDRLAGMNYRLAEGRTLMRHRGLVTINLVHASSDTTFSVRNAFASGGIIEDPATGAAAAALAGYLRQLDWPHCGRIEIAQGDDMGCPSRIIAEIPPETGASIRISGRVRAL